MRPDVHEATFRVEGRGAFADLTRDIDARIELWCNDHCDLLRVRGDTDNALRESIGELTGVRDSMAEGGEEVIVTEDCLERHEGTMVETYISRHDCLLLPPLNYEQGYKTCRVLALKPGNLTGVYRDLVAHTTVTVESKREVGESLQHPPQFTVGTEMPTLSPRQREVLLRAHELGYYEIPRETTTAEIAATVGVQRRTAEQHLRRAENKLIETCVDFFAAIDQD